MPIEISVRNPSGVTLRFHRATRVTIDLLTGMAQVIVASHADQEAYNTNPMLVAWTWPLDFIATEFLADGASLDAIEEKLITWEGSPFQGGNQVVDSIETLDVARRRAWAAVKAARAAAEGGVFAFDENIYDADTLRISGAVQLAVLAKANDLPYSETWTLADNSTRALDADQVIALGIALGQYVSSVYSTGRALRAQIEAAETIEALNAIRWPT
ncbi:MAG: DUF4376 domain-containing protein [Proteobacteria bacterium]|nr:MAG: DUF4376 domain-containing protein [Pseudomonadota bacterium]